MGRKPLGPPTPFSEALARYLLALLQEHGADASGRWLSKRVGRSYTYWHTVLTARTQSLTTNDIDLIAEALGRDPFEMMTEAIEHVSAPPAPVPFDVSKLPPVVGREHLEGLRAVAEDQYTMPSEDDHTP